jgi:lipopolysaccharide/colanic/teichoic acid biosynthesis glycosyltransferase
MTTESAEWTFWYFYTILPAARLIRLPGRKENRAMTTPKRMFDFCFSIMLLSALSPLFVLIAMLVSLTSSGPAIFRQRRVGYRGAIFTIFKFRSMSDGSGQPTDYISPGDNRITPLGRFLRSTHLDELPQLWNVVRGEMSLVGPRPIPPEWNVRRESEIFGYRRRLDMMPGITGLAQVRGRPKRAVRCEFRKRFLLDLFYIRHQCFLLDLRILLKTFSAMLKRQGV